MAAARPADVNTSPLSTYKTSLTTSISAYCERSTSVACQWVVALRPSSRPASARRKAPMHNDDDSNTEVLCFAQRPHDSGRRGCQTGNDDRVGGLACRQVVFDRQGQPEVELHGSGVLGRHREAIPRHTHVWIASEDLGGDGEIKRAGLLPNERHDTMTRGARHAVIFVQRPKEVNGHILAVDVFRNACAVDGFGAPSKIQSMGTINQGRMT